MSRAPVPTADLALLGPVLADVPYMRAHTFFRILMGKTVMGVCPWGNTGL